MMRGLRARTKGILWFVVFAFVGSIGLIWGADVLGPGGQGRREPGVVGEVNGVKIYAPQLGRAIERAFSAYEQQRGRRPTDEDEILALQEDAWNSLVADILLAQEIEKRDIRITDEELLLHIKGNPPLEVRRMEVFQTDGQFDHRKYLQALQDPRYDWASLEYMVRSQLPRVKLEQEITAAARVTEDEVRQAFVLQNEKVKVTYVFFGPTDFADEEIPAADEDLHAYYEAHREDYRLPEHATLRWVGWPREPSPEDDAVIREQADEILAEIRDGEDFAELAEIYSDDPGSASNGGDVGFFGRGAMVPEFEEVAFALDVGEVSEPVRTRYGYHIIKVEEKKSDTVRARHILLKLEPSRRTLEDLWNRAAQFDSVASAAGFEQAAVQFGLQVSETDPFPRGSYLPGIGRSTRANRMAFDRPEGAVFGPFEAGESVIMAQVVGREASRIPSFEEVSEQVERQFETSRRREMAAAEIERVAAEIAGGKTLEQAAPSEAIRHAGPFSEATASGSVASDPAFLGTVFVLPQGEISDVVETRSGFVIARVDEKTPFDEEEYEKSKQQLRAQLLMRKQQAVFSLWFDEVYEAADIRDYRDRPLAS